MPIATISTAKGPARRAGQADGVLTAMLDGHITIAGGPWRAPEKWSRGLSVADSIDPGAPTALTCPVRSLGNERCGALESVEICESGVDPAVALRVVRTRTSGLDKVQFISFGERDADAAHLLLADTPASTIIQDGEAHLLGPRRAGHSNLSDLRPRLYWQADHALDLLTFVVPRQALERWAADAGLRSFAGLHYRPSQRLIDGVVVGFGLALLPFLDRPDTAPRLFVDQVLQTVCAYLARNFATWQQPLPHKGGLAPWQERRAKEMMVAHLDNRLSLEALAIECRLSVSHFTKAFQKTLGQSPHQWLLEQRVEQARTLLMTSCLTLSEIAIACGFSDQSHFSRVFAKRVGASPGAWRRAHSKVHA